MICDKGSVCRILLSVTFQVSGLDRLLEAYAHRLVEGVWRGQRGAQRHELLLFICEEEEEEIKEHTKDPRVYEK